MIVESSRRHLEMAKPKKRNIKQEDGAVFVSTGSIIAPCYVGWFSGTIFGGGVQLGN